MKPNQLKVFTSNHNNRPVAWIVDWRGIKYSDIYSGKTCHDAAVACVASLDQDKIWRQSGRKITEIQPL